MGSASLWVTIIISLLATFVVVPTSQKQNLAKITNGFTITFFNTISETLEEYENRVLSPLNIENAMLILVNAALSTTSKQILRVFGISNIQSLTNINRQFKYFLKRLTVNQKNTTSELVAGLYVKKGCPLKKRYKKSMIVNYKAKIKNADFSRNSVAITNDINNKVNKTTRGLISKLYPEPLPKYTMVDIFTVIYFNSSWPERYFKLESETRTFNLLPKGTKEIYYLTNDVKMAGYTVMDDCQIVDIVYSNDNFSLFIFLPQEGYDPKVCVNKLTPQKISDIFDNTQRRQFVNIRMPPFKFRTNFPDLIPAFKMLGVKQAFINGNFSRGIDQCKCGGLVVSNIAHKAEIEVNERGTAAGGATGITVIPTAVPVSIDFIVNRPYIFAIGCNKLKIITFIGTVYDPTSSS